MNTRVEQAVSNILDGESIDTQVDDLLEYRAVLKRVGTFAGVGAIGGSLANYIHARGRGLRGRQALRAAGRGAAYGGLAGAGLGGYSEYQRRVADAAVKRYGASAEKRFRHYTDKTVSGIEQRLSRHDPIERLGRAASRGKSAAAKGKEKLAGFFRGRR